MSRLTILAADLSGSEADLLSVFDDWAEADLLNTIALVDMAHHEQEFSPVVRWVHKSQCRDLPLRKVLTLERYVGVTLVSIRAGRLEDYGQDRFSVENELVMLVKPRFRHLNLRAITVGIADPTYRCSHLHFDPLWDLHILHDPHLIADDSVAVIPLEPEHRSSVCLLTATAVAGAFRWQRRASVTFADQAAGIAKPARLARVQLRVVNAGHYVDKVIAGAFLESGWNIPPGVVAVQAPPGLVGA